MIKRRPTTYKQTLKELSDAWVKTQGLPHGSEIVLIRRNGVRKRNDVVIHHRMLPPPHPPAVPLGEAIDYLKGLLITDIGARGLTLNVLDPSGNRLSAKLHMATLRKMPGKPTENERAQDELDDAEIDLVKKVHQVPYRDLQRTYGSEKAIRGILRSLTEIEGKGELMDALKEEGLV